MAALHMAAPPCYPLAPPCSACRDDDENGHYQFAIGENLAPRFKIMRKFGEGTFGQVGAAVLSLAGQRTMTATIRQRQAAVVADTCSPDGTGSHAPNRAIFRPLLASHRWHARVAAWQETAFSDSSSTPSLFASACLPTLLLPPRLCCSRCWSAGTASARTLWQ